MSLFSSIFTSKPTPVTYTEPITTFTENGALSLATTEDPLVDLFFKLVRNIPESTVNDLFAKAWDYDSLRTLRMVFQTRDCRDIGKGDRAPFWRMVQYMMNHGLSEHLIPNLEHLPEYGYWKDILGFLDTPLETNALMIMGEQLMKDWKNMQEGKPVSLAAKYAPTPGGAHDNKSRAVKKLLNCMAMLRDEEGVPIPKNECEYRTVYLSPLREYLKVVERLMCAQRWSDIEYKRVPSVAMNRLKSVFEKHEPERWAEYQKALKAGTEKVNGSQLYPHEIVEKVLSHKCDIILEKQWEQQVEKITPEAREKLKKTLVISDVSGSMNGVPVYVSIGLGLLISSVLPEPWANQLITFSENPTFHKICGTTLEERVRDISKMNWGGSTNLTETFNMILKKCIENEVSAADMPDKLLILSDMQFNETDRNWEKNHSMIERKFLENGYEMPTIIYWNLRGNTLDFPVNASQSNVICISGYSPTILNVILEGKNPNPSEIVKSILDNTRYKRIQLSI